MLNLDELLNAEQARAARHTEGPLLVLAGAGSGKTRVITYRIANLITQLGLKPWQILAVTFTNKAAAEMRERVEGLLGPEARDLWLGTFHSICLRVLRRHADLVHRTSSFVVYDEDDREKLLKRVLKSENISKDVLTVRKVRYWLDDQKHRLRGPNHPELPAVGHIDRLCARVYRGYEQAKRRADAFDFSDLIFHAVKLMEKNPAVLSEYQYRWRYMLVDEFQDTDHAQYRLLKLLAGDRANLCVVGDDDQSIYRWRGAEVKNILGFPMDFPNKTVEVVRLERNYRSTGNVLAAASALIKNNSERHDKTLWTDQPAGDPIGCYQAETESGEARWVVRKALELRRGGVPLRQITVFYRTHSQSRVFEDALRQRSTPYIVVGGLKFYERKEVKDILAYLRLVANPRDDIAFLRVVNTPARGIGGTTIQRAQAIADAEERPLFDASQLLAQRPEGGRAKKKLEGFSTLMATLRNVAHSTGDVFRVAEAVLSETGYLTRLKDEGTLESETRAENLDELMLSIQEWRTRAEDRSLAAFLDHVSLLTSLDESDPGADAMTLMTVHAAKGLEFDTVFVTGLEEDVFPHFNSKEEEAIEEERRLAYVAITRGKQRVFLTWARSRQRFGRLDMNPPSRFLGEIPKEITSFHAERGFSRDQALGSAGRRGSVGRGAGGWTGGGSFAGSRDPFAGGTPKRDAPRSGSWASASSADSQADGDDGPTLDYSTSQVAADDFDSGGGSWVGRRVRHPRFGVGKVARVDGTGDRAKVTVQFRSFGSKTIIAKFLELA